MAVLNTVNGKTPSTAKVGDIIVTNGGSFQITGRKADGSWSSKKVAEAGQSPTAAKTGGGSSGSSTAKRPGSAASVSTGTAEQDRIKAQMNANSRAWKDTADPAERERLHAENQRLAAQLGGSVSFDSRTGTWSGQAAAPEPPAAMEPDVASTADQSEYLRKLADAYLKRQREALKLAYEENTAALQAQKDSLGADYQAARNRTAADEALARRNFQETAVAYGLGSGTMGQANLAFASGLQRSLGTLEAQETAANQEVERQRTSLARTYQSAMVQAQAENDYRLFEKLYSEAVRVDEALRQQSQFNANLALRQYQTLLDQYNADRTYRYGLEKREDQTRLDEAALLARAGDYSLYGDYYGWDADRVARLEQLWTAANTPKAKSTGSSGRRGSSSSSSGGTGDGYDSPYEDLYRQGIDTYGDAYAALLQQKYSATSADKLAKSYVSMRQRRELVFSAADLGTAARALLERFARGGVGAQARESAIESARRSGSITQAEANFLREA